MRTNIDIDDELIKQALRLSHLKTKKEVVHQALEHYVKRLRRLKLLGSYFFIFLAQHILYFL